jgi:hypothetical protein
VAVANGVDDHVGGKEFSALAHTETLGFEASCGGRRPKCDIGNTESPNLFDVETRKMLAGDFVLLTAFETPRAYAPAAHPTGGFENIERIVDDGINE